MGSAREEQTECMFEDPCIEVSSRHGAVFFNSNTREEGNISTSVNKASSAKRETCIVEVGNLSTLILPTCTKSKGCGTVLRASPRTALEIRV